MIQPRVDSTGKGGMISPEQDELKSFLMVLRQALLMVVRYIEKKYGTDK